MPHLPQNYDKKEDESALSGIVVPLLPFGMPRYDAGERFDLRSPYADDGWVDPEETGVLWQAWFSVFHMSSSHGGGVWVCEIGWGRAGTWEGRDSAGDVACCPALQQQLARPSDAYDVRGVAICRCLGWS